jgi:PKD repeat protein
MNKFISFTKWAFTVVTVVALVFIYSCSDDPVEEPDPIAPGLSYAATTVEVGETGTITAAVTGDPATYAITDDGEADFVTVNANTGELTVGAESTTGSYSVEVTANNAGGNTTAIAEITISANEDFDPSGKKVIWKYWMNNTPDVVMYNLNTLPGQEGLPAEIPIPTGWPADWPNINLADPMLQAYFTFPTVQFFLQQVPGDVACELLEPAENGDTLLLIVNSDLTLSTICRNAEDGTTGTTVDLGTSAISYDGSGFSWTLNLTFIGGIPVTYEIGGAAITDFVDPLDPSWFAPSGTPRQFSAVTGTVESYQTPTDFLDDESYLSSIQLLNVDVVLEILE